MRHDNVILSLFFSMAHLESESETGSHYRQADSEEMPGTAGEEGVVK
jgi:hypothetical protein